MEENYGEVDCHAGLHEEMVTMAVASDKFRLLFGKREEPVDYLGIGDA